MPLLLLDTWASTLQGQGQSKAKGLVAVLAQKAYWARQELVLLGFGNDEIKPLYTSGRAPKTILPLLDQLATAGCTPLRQAVQQGIDLCKKLVAAQFRSTNHVLHHYRWSQSARSAWLIPTWH